MQRVPLELDIENLVGFFQVKLRDQRNGQVWDFSMYPGSAPLNLAALVALLSVSTIYTFNGTHYDLPILTLALHGATHEQLKEAGDNIIVRGWKHWDFYRNYGIEPPEWIDHVDLFEVSPGVNIGLKLYMGRIHAPKMQDLPVPFDRLITPVERVMTSLYCDNDLEGTGLLRHELRDRLALREAMSERYGVDLRSKSDAQIAESVIKAQLAFAPNKRYIPHGFTFGYEPPAFLRYVSPDLQKLLKDVREASFTVSDREEAHSIGLYDEDAPKIRTGVQIPKELKGRDIRIGKAVYRLGIGGLHSQEKCVHHIAIPGVFTLRDVDVKSYYPSLILLMGMYPAQLGPGFLSIYESVYKRRLAAKDAGEMTESDGLKIVLNGTFGKLFSKWSILYAPEFGIATTLTGQLALLMLIEMMELSGISVVSANTDGIVLKIPHGLDVVADQVVAWWERATGLQMEASQYRALYSRDVNNYVAITTDGKVKRKGVFTPGGLLSGPQGKHPCLDICADAVVAYLKDGTPLDATIRGCTDIRKFVQIRHCKGGAIDLPAGVAIADGKYLGKAVRFYLSGRPGYIGQAGTGDKVAGTTGATPCMELPTYLPADINYQHYIQVATDMLADIGVAYA